MYIYSVYQAMLLGHTYVGLFLSFASMYLLYPIHVTITSQQVHFRITYLYKGVVNVGRLVQLVDTWVGVKGVFGSTSTNIAF